MTIKHDTHNYRKHDDKNLKLIKKSLKEVGAGRSIVIDSEDEIIAGNATYAQAQKLGIPIKIIESDGKELIAVKRVDLKTEDQKRKKLALLDNSTLDKVEWNFDNLSSDFELEELQDLGIEDLQDLVKGPQEVVEDLNSQFEIVVECESEEEQQTLFNKFTSEGYKCRILTF